MASIINDYLELDKRYKKLNGSYQLLQQEYETLLEKYKQLEKYVEELKQQENLNCEDCTCEPQTLKKSSEDDKYDYLFGDEGVVDENENPNEELNEKAPTVEEIEKPKKTRKKKVEKDGNTETES